MKRWIVLLMSLMALAVSGAESFTNLTGKIFGGVTVVRTNKGEIVFKQEGKLGFFTESLTNLPAELQKRWAHQETAKAPARGAEDTNSVAWVYAQMARQRDQLRDLLSEMRGKNVTTTNWQDYADVCASARKEASDIWQTLADKTLDVTLRITVNTDPMLERLKLVKQKEEDAAWDAYTSNRINAEEKSRRLIAAHDRYQIELRKIWAIDARSNAATGAYETIKDGFWNLYLDFDAMWGAAMDEKFKLTKKMIDGIVAGSARR